MEKRIAHPGSAFLLCLALIVLGLVVMAACIAPAPTATPTATPQPTATQPPPTVEDDWTRIKEAGVIQVASALDNPPFEMYTARLKPDGFDIALMTELASRLGLKPEFNDFAFEGLLDGLELKQVDAVISAMAVTDARRAQADFTTAYYLGEDSILAAPDSPIEAVSTVDDLAGRRVGVVDGTVYESWLQENLVETGKMPPANLQTYTKASDAVSSLAPALVDLVILDREVAQTYANEGLGKVVGKSKYVQNYGIAVRKGSSLLPQLNKALAEVQADGTLARLAERYLNVPSDKVLPIPTPAAQPTAAPAPVGSPTPAPCKNSSEYGQPLDLTIPDWTPMKPGESFTKGWRLVNSGTCDWAADYSFVFSSGSRMGGQDARIGRVVPVGGPLDVYVAMQAPSAPGEYSGFWQMQDAKGTPFGKRVSVNIVVPSPTPAAPPPTQTPVPGISFWADSYNLNAGQSTTIHWRTQGVKEVYFYQEGQSWQNYPVTGNEDRSVRPDRSTTYYLRVVFPNGTSQTPSLRINVQAAASWPVITRFDSDPDRELCLGDCVELKWDVDGADRVALVRDGGALWDGAPSHGSKDDCGISTAGDHMYELQAWGPGGTGPVKDQLWITAVGGCGTPPPEIAWFNSDPSGSVLQGQCVYLSWDIQGGFDGLELKVNGNPVAGGAGTFSYEDCGCPKNTGTCNYDLRVWNQSGESTARQSVEVIMQTLPGNPAATYCEDNGGQYSIEQDTCTLRDGTVCDAWAYMNGECP